MSEYLFSQSQNPKKELTINYPKDKILDALEKVATLHPEDYRWKKKDEGFGRYILECKWGIYWKGFVEVNVLRNPDETTLLKLEAGDSKGSINGKVEFDNATKDLSRVTDLLSDYLQGKVDASGSAKIEKSKGCLVLLPILLAAAGCIVYAIIIYAR